MDGCRKRYEDGSARMVLDSGVGGTVSGTRPGSRRPGRCCSRDEVLDAGRGTVLTESSDGLWVAMSRPLDVTPFPSVPLPSPLAWGAALVLNAPRPPPMGSISESSDCDRKSSSSSAARVATTDGRSPFKNVRESCGEARSSCAAALPPL